jgi:excisionase family DNA binding protein
MHKSGLYTPVEVAAMLRVTRQYIYTLIWDGVIEAIVLPNARRNPNKKRRTHYRIRREEVEKLLKAKYDVGLLR